MRGLLIALFVLIVLGLVVLFGPPLPGPNVREWFGVANPPDLTPCTPRAAVVRSPASPKPGAGSWRRERDSLLARTEMTGVAVDGTVLTLAGQPPSRDVLAFDPGTGRFSRETRLPVPVDHALAVADAGSVYVIGGYLAPRNGEVAGEPTNRGWRYDRARRTWSEIPPMQKARGGLMGAVVDGRIYAIAGGPNPFPEDGSQYRDVEIFDTRSGRWAPGPPIPTSRHHAGAAALDGKVYVAGGRRTGDYSMSSFERLDPRSGRWERLDPLPLGVGDLRIVATEHQIVAIGGDDETGWEEGRGFITPATWSYAPRAGRWTRLPDLNQPRHGFAAGYAAGRVYVFEGSPCPGHGFSRTVESLRVPADRP